MNSRRVVAAWLGMLSVMWPVVAAAQTPAPASEPQGSKSAGEAGGPQDILSAVPGDAWAVLWAPNIGKTDARLTAMIQRLNLPMMGSPLMMAKAMMGMNMGFDDTGEPIKAVDFDGSGERLAMTASNNSEARIWTVLMFQAWLESRGR